MPVIDFGHADQFVAHRLTHEHMASRPLDGAVAADAPELMTSGYSWSGSYEGIGQDEGTYTCGGVRIANASCGRSWSWIL